LPIPFDHIPESIDYPLEVGRGYWIITETFATKGYTINRQRENTFAIPLKNLKTKQ
jgi:hypothetical protein